MATSEGGTYVADWTRVGRKYRAILRDNRAIQVEASNLEELVEDLHDEIMKWQGDGEAVVELYPAPVPDSSFVALAYNEAVRVSNEPASLFEGGVCNKCGSGRGQRTAASLVLARKPRGDVFRAEHPWPKDVMPARVCISAKLATRFSEKEQAVLGLRPIERPKDVKQEYFEICGEAVTSTVGLRGCTYATALGQSWKCTECGKSSLVIKEPKISSSARFLASSSLRGVDRDFFLFHESGIRGPRPAFAPARWHSLLDASRDLKGLSSSEIIVLPDAQADLDPCLPPYPEA